MATEQDKRVNTVLDTARAHVKAMADAYEKSEGSWLIFRVIEAVTFLFWHTFGVAVSARVTKPEGMGESIRVPDLAESFKNVKLHPVTGPVVFSRTEPPARGQVDGNHVTMSGAGAIGGAGPQPQPNVQNLSPFSEFDDASTWVRISQRDVEPKLSPPEENFYVRRESLIHALGASSTVVPEFLRQVLKELGANEGETQEAFAARIKTMQATLREEPIERYEGGDWVHVPCDAVEMFDQSVPGTYKIGVKAVLLALQGTWRSPSIETALQESINTARDTLRAREDALQEAIGVRRDAVESLQKAEVENMRLEALVAHWQTVYAQLVARIVGITDTLAPPNHKVDCILQAIAKPVEAPEKRISFAGAKQAALAGFLGVAPVRIVPCVGCPGATCPVCLGYEWVADGVSELAIETSIGGSAMALEPKLTDILIMARVERLRARQIANGRYAAPLQYMLDSMPQSVREGIARDVRAVLAHCGLEAMEARAKEAERKLIDSQHAHPSAPVLDRMASAARDRYKEAIAKSEPEPWKLAMLAASGERVKG